MQIFLWHIRRIFKSLERVRTVVSMSPTVWGPRRLPTRSAREEVSLGFSYFKNHLHLEYFYTLCAVKPPDRLNLGQHNKWSTTLIMLIQTNNQNKPHFPTWSSKHMVLWLKLGKLIVIRTLKGRWNELVILSLGQISVLVISLFPQTGKPLKQQVHSIVSISFPSEIALMIIICSISIAFTASLNASIILLCF